MQKIENSTSWRDCIIITIVFIIVMFLHNYSTKSWIDAVTKELKNVNTTLIDIKELLEKPCEIEITD